MPSGPFCPGLLLKINTTGSGESGETFYSVTIESKGTAEFRSHLCRGDLGILKGE